MPLSLTGLSKIATGGATASGRTKMLSLWSYATPDAAAAVESAGYFNGAAGLLTKGDIIFSSMVRDGTTVLKTYTVASSDGTATVSIAAQTVA